MNRRQAAAAIVMLSACLVGGDEVVGVAVEYFRRKPIDLARPPADVPFPLRVKNYVRHREGSCFHVSTQVALRWADQGAIADNWRQSFGGGASTSDIARILDRYKIPYKRTHIVGYGPNEDGNVEILDYAHNHRLAAAIHYFRGHAINFLGWVEKDGQAMACLLDNNRPQEFIFVEKNQFLWNWRNRYHGGAIVPLVQPLPPLPYDPRDFLEKP
ncbi:hypothetical protein AB1K70_26565 [Bremerella sp. JC770]|uniref:hypothetical protein n=1 Tax=Bremerella sp. JC770 TaxID=3232137 RepID=UPI0034593B14